MEGFSFKDSKRWLTKNIFLECIRHFEKHVCCTNEKTVLILLDNHVSHVRIEILDFRREMILSDSLFYFSHGVQLLNRTSLFYWKHGSWQVKENIWTPFNREGLLPSSCCFWKYHSRFWSWSLHPSHFH